MKRNVEYLFKNQLVNFEKVLIQRYLELRIDETDVLLLLHLYEMETSNIQVLSVSDLTNKTTLNIDDVANRVDLLVTKGFISLDIMEEEGLFEERFSVLPTLFMLIEQEPEISKPETKKFVEMMENELNRPLSSKELQIIESWTYSVDEVKSAILDALKVKKMGVEYISKILENNKNEVKKDMTYFDQFLNE